MTSFHVENFGCRAARADGEAVAARLRLDGLSESDVAGAAVVVVNTCSVTAEADRDARAFLRKINRLNPAAKVVVTGCYAQRAPEEIAALNGVSAVVGNSHKGLVPEIIRNLLNPVRNLTYAVEAQFVPAASLTAHLNMASSNTGIWVDDKFAHSEIESAAAFAPVEPGIRPGGQSGIRPGTQTRPNLKIQEGCSNRCTFCIIPTTRGHSRSLAAAKVFSQIEGFVAAGGQELVLSGINLGRWGRDLPAESEFRYLACLIRGILERTALPRLRLSSIEPMDWGPELISLMRDFGRSRLARHAHLPLQSGSDAVLRRMHRRYRPWHYAEKVSQLISAAGWELALGADVMVGFPGETDAEFRETYDFVAGQPFTYLHLFPFSARPGTLGWTLHREAPVAGQAVRERMGALRALIFSKSSRYKTSFVGKTLSAVTLNPSESIAASGRTSGLSSNFLPLEISASLPANQLVEVRITALLDSGALLSEPVSHVYSSEIQIAVAI